MFASDEKLLSLLGVVTAALQREQQANSPQARAAAQSEALKAQAALDEASGVASLIRRRLLAAIEDASPGIDVDDLDYRKRIRRLVRDDSPAARIKLRQGLGRLIYDDAAIIGNELAHHLAGHVMQTTDGRYGLMAVEPKQGVDPETGAAYMLRLQIIDKSGYTVGLKVAGERVPSAYWTLAAKAYNAHAAKLRRNGEKAPAVSAATVKDWCLRDGKGRELFERAREDGRIDRATNGKDHDRLLS